MISKSVFHACGLVAFLATNVSAQENNGASSNKTFLAFTAAYSEQYKTTLGLDLSSYSGAAGGTNLSLSASSHKEGHRVNLRFDRGVQSFDGLGGPKLFYGVTVNDQNWQDSAYNTRRLGGFVGAFWNLGETDKKLSVRYTFGKSRISDVSATTSTLVAAEAGEVTQSSLRMSYQLPARPLTQDGKWNFAFSSSVELYGLGGDAKFTNLSANARLSRELTNGFTLTGRANAGTSTGFGGYAPRVTERAFLAPSMPRGYAFAGIGPVDYVGGTRTGLGGLNYASLSLEVGKNFLEMQKSTVNGYIFADAGSVWELDNTIIPGGAIDDGFHLRGSVGVGIGWTNKVGELSVTYATTIGEQSTDLKQPWQIGFRSNF